MFFRARRRLQAKLPDQIEKREEHIQEKGRVQCSAMMFRAFHRPVRPAPHHLHPLRGDRRPTRAIPTFIFMTYVFILCVILNFHEQFFSSIKTQLYLDEFLRGCDGVGGLQVDFVRGSEGVGGQGESPGGASGGRGGKGEESNDQHGGKVWRFEAVRRNGGIGVDSSEEKLGLEVIDRSGIGGIDGLEDDRVMLGNCGRVVGTEDCRVVVVEN